MITFIIFQTKFENNTKHFFIELGFFNSFLMILAYRPISLVRQLDLILQPTNHDFLQLMVVFETEDDFE